MDNGRLDNRDKGCMEVNVRPMSEAFETSRALYLSIDPSTFLFILKIHLQRTISFYGQEEKVPMYGF